MSSEDSERQKLIKAYQDTFNTESGKMVLHDLMRRHRVFSVHYLPGDQLTPDGIGMAVRNAWNQGQRSVVVEIMGRLQMNLNDALDAQEEMGNAGTGSRYRRMDAVGAVGSDG